MKTKLAAPHPHVEKRPEEHRALAPRAEGPKSIEKAIKNAAAYNPHAIDKLEKPPTTRLLGDDIVARDNAAARARDSESFNRRFGADNAAGLIKTGAAIGTVLGGSAAVVAGLIGGPVAAASAGIALGLTGLPFVALGVFTWAITR